MSRKPKMPKYAGLRMTDMAAFYTITMDIVPADFGIGEHATNSEMVRGLTDHINAKITKAREAARAAGAAHERAAVVAMLLQSPDPVWAEVARCIMDGEHVAPAAGGAR